MEDINMKKWGTVFMLTLFLGVSGFAKITREHFKQIQENMTYEEVVNIIGHEGNLLSESDDLEIYDWSNPDGSGIMVTFAKGRVFIKVQVRLK